jgi:rhodanese-related sulfurtransferase
MAFINYNYISNVAESQKLLSKHKKPIADSRKLTALLEMDITVEELKDRLDKGETFNFLDVREEYEYDEENLGAKLIPLGELPDRLDEISDWKDQEVVVHCRSGARSGRAKAFMESQGFSNVRNVTGGILAYNQL